MAFLPGDIVLISHAPFSNQQGYKARPVLVVSSEDFNRSQADVVCVAISSRLRAGDPYRVEVPEHSTHFPRTGLKQSSCVKCGTLFAYESSGIRRKLGSLPNPLLEDVRRLVRSILDL